MSTRVHESDIINAPIEKVWNAVRPLTFAFSHIVQKVALENKAAEAEVGGVRHVTYKDGTEQHIKLLELSDIDYSVTYEIIESKPPVNYLSAIHTIRLRRVTKKNVTFIEAVSDFSHDASQAVIQDSKFKKLELFADLERALH